MRRSGNVILILIGLVIYTNAYSQNVWSEVSLNKTSVYVGEPVEVTITVYTSTWFTKGLDLGNIKVNGAFSVYFRPVSTSFSRDSKTYAGVQQIYHVFPYSEKDIVFPSLDITIESPPEGGFKGERQIVKTAEKPIRVQPAPGGFDQDQWLVTTDLSVADRWQGDLQNVKVGDVLVRRIDRTAQGTVAELIPPINWDSIPGVSQYRARSNVENSKTTTTFSASRTETTRFLFEKEGEVTIPAMVFDWYNPVEKQPYKRTLKEISITVKPNPDLGVLASVRDSLRVQQEQMLQESEEDQPFRLLGLSPKQLLGIIFLTIIIVYVLVHLVKWARIHLRKRHEQYLRSEAYYFDRFKKMAAGNHPKSTLNALYRWIDELHLREPSLKYFARNYGSEQLLNEVTELEKSSVDHLSKFQINIGEWKKARQRYNHGQIKTKPFDSISWINPVSYKSV
jgi:hypothetical protein